MIDTCTIPASKIKAEEHLIARKIQLLELAAAISFGEVTSLSQVSGFIWNTIEEIEVLLGDNNE